MAMQVSGIENELEKHEFDITSLIFKNNKVYSASDDGKIKMWSMDLKLIKEIQAHQYSVYSLTADNKNMVYSCSSDGSIKAWNAETLVQEIVVQNENEYEMWKLYWGDETLVAVDERGIIYLHKENKDVAFVEMLEQIKDVAIKDNLLYTVRDLDLIIAEFIPGKRGIITYHQTLAGRAPLCLIGDKLCYSSRDGRHIFINYRKSNCAEVAKIKDAHELVINAITGNKVNNDTFLYSGGWDKKVKEWQLTNDGVTAIGSYDVDGYVNVICAADNNRIVYAGGAEGKIWRIEAT